MSTADLPPVCCLALVFQPEAEKVCGEPDAREICVTQCKSNAQCLWLLPFPLLSNESF